jgi:hypothetical protein
MSFYTGSVPPENKKHTSSLALLNMYFVTTNFDTLDGVRATAFGKQIAVVGLQILHFTVHSGLKTCTPSRISKQCNPIFKTRIL